MKCFPQNSFAMVNSPEDDCIFVSWVILASTGKGPLPSRVILEHQGHRKMSNPRDRRAGRIRPMTLRPEHLERREMLTVDISALAPAAAMLWFSGGMSPVNPDTNPDNSSNSITNTTTYSDATSTATSTQTTTWTNSGTSTYTPGSSGGSSSAGTTTWNSHRHSVTTVVSHQIYSGADPWTSDSTSTTISDTTSSGTITSGITTYQSQVTNTSTSTTRTSWTSGAALTGTYTVYATSTLTNSGSQGGSGGSANTFHMTASGNDSLVLTGSGDRARSLGTGDDASTAAIREQSAYDMTGDKRSGPIASSSYHLTAGGSATVTSGDTGGGTTPDGSTDQSTSSNTQTNTYAATVDGSGGATIDTQSFTFEDHATGDSTSHSGASASRTAGGTSGNDGGSVDAASHEFADLTLSGGTSPTTDTSAYTVDTGGTDTSTTHMSGNGTMTFYGADPGNVSGGGSSPGGYDPFSPGVAGGVGTIMSQGYDSTETTSQTDRYTASGTITQGVEVGTYVYTNSGTDSTSLSATTSPQSASGGATLTEVTSSHYSLTDRGAINAAGVESSTFNATLGDSNANGIHLTGLGGLIASPSNVDTSDGEEGTMSGADGVVTSFTYDGRRAVGGGVDGSGLAGNYHESLDATGAVQASSTEVPTGPGGPPLAALALNMPATGPVLALLMAGAPGVATEHNYGPLFIEKTPDYPGGDWEIHHTKQKQLAERYMTEKGINVHESEFLRGVPKAVHDDISELQREWQIAQMRKLGILGKDEPLSNLNRGDAFSKLWKKVPLSEAMDFEKSIDNAFNRYWLTAESGQKARVAGILEAIKPDGVYSRNRNDRLGRVMNKVGNALAILAVVTNGAAMAYAFSNPSPEQAGAYNDFLAAYQSAILEERRRGSLTRNTAEQFQEKYLAYLRAINVADSVIAASAAAMQNWIELNAPS